MPFRSRVPRTTHQWLKPFYDYIDDGVIVTIPSGASGNANAVWLGSNVPITQIANATGVVGFYGSTGIAKTSSYGVSFYGTGLGASGLGATGMGTSGIKDFMAQWGWNGGSGTFVTIDDIVAQLKNVGFLSP